MADITMYSGTFSYVDPAYGFIKNVKTVSGGTKCKDVFLRASALVEHYGRRRHILKALDGDNLVFSLRESDMHPGKMEAVVHNNPSRHYAFI